MEHGPSGRAGVQRRGKTCALEGHRRRHGRCWTCLLVWTRRDYVRHREAHRAYQKWFGPRMRDRIYTRWLYISWRAIFCSEAVLAGNPNPARWFGNSGRSKSGTAASFAIMPNGAAGAVRGESPVCRPVALALCVRSTWQAGGLGV